MRRKDRELPVDEAWRILEAGRVAHLGLISAGHPYVVPVSHVVLDGRIYFHSASEGEKLAAIAANPEVCVETAELGEKPGDCFTYRSAIAFGTARVIADRALKRRVLSAIVAKYQPGYPQREGDEDRVAIVEIEVERVTGKHRQ